MPALSVTDQLVSIQDQEGREVRRRSKVFMFDAAAYRRALVVGQVWLAEVSCPATRIARPGP